MRFEFAEGSAKLLLNPVNLVEELATVDIELAATKFPVRSQQEVVLEDLILIRIQRTPAYKTEVGNKFLIFQPPHGFSLPAWISFQRHPADVFLFRATLPKTRIASAKNRPKNAIAGS